MTNTTEEKPTDHSPGMHGLRTARLGFLGVSIAAHFLALVTGSIFFSVIGFVSLICWFILYIVSNSLDQANQWHNRAVYYISRRVNMIDKEKFDHLMSNADIENKVIELTQELDAVKSAFENFKQGLQAGKADTNAGTGKQD